MRAREILATRFFGGGIDRRIPFAMDELKSNLKKALREKQIKVPLEIKQQIHKVLDEFFS